MAAKKRSFFAATFRLQKYNLFHYHQMYFCFFSSTYLLSYQRYNEQCTKSCFWLRTSMDGEISKGYCCKKKERLIAANLFLCALPAEGILDVYNRLVDGIKCAHNQFCHYIRLSIFVLIYYRIVNTLIFLTIRVNDPSKPLVNDFQS